MNRAKLFNKENNVLYNVAENMSWIENCFTCFDIKREYCYSIDKDCHLKKLYCKIIRNEITVARET